MMQFFKKFIPLFSLVLMSISFGAHSRGAHPSISILSPADNSQLLQVNEISFQAVARDRRDGDISHKIQWYSNIQGSIGSGATFSRTLQTGYHVVRAEVRNSKGKLERDYVDLYVDAPENKAPTINILSPESGSEYTEGSLVFFKSYANDTEDGDLSHLTQWKSDKDGFLGTGTNINAVLTPGNHTVTASVKDSANATASTQIAIAVTMVTNSAPQVSIDTPATNSSFEDGTIVTLISSATDAEDGELSSQVIWHSNIDGNLGTGQTITTLLSAGSHTITAEVFDSENATDSAQINLNIIKPVNNTPSLEITAPTNLAEFMSEDVLVFTAVASDTEDGDLASQVIWSSSIEGMLGKGASLQSTLSTGTHTISATVTDSQNAQATSQITLIVKEPQNSIPTVSIDSPASASNHSNSSQITFAGYANDAEDGVISDVISWHSNIDGVLGHGAIISGNLSVGTHTITAMVLDSKSEQAQTSIWLTVEQANSEEPSHQVYYISPYGNDSNSGTSADAPWKTFKRSFASNGVQAGEELVLLDGEYSVANQTGILREVDYYGNSVDYSDSIPSGLSREQPTVVRAANPGMVKVIGSDELRPLFIGRSSRKDKFIKVQGITFEGGGSLFNADYVVIKDSGFHGSFSIGTNDHSQGNNYNLVEDVWVWASNRRIIASNYRSNNNVWRRVVVRSEGCDQAGCESYPKADPSVGMTVYDSQNVSVQNVIIIDRVIRNDSAYGDFATAQHSSNRANYLGNNEWLGNMSINSQDSGMHFEADYVLDNGLPIWTIKNFVSVGNGIGGINIGNTPYNYDSAGKPQSFIDNATIVMNNAGDNKSAIRVSPNQSSVLVSDSLTVGATRTGYNVLGSMVQNSLGYNPGAAEGNFDTYNCLENCISLTNSPLTDGSLLFPQRLEENAPAQNTLPQKIGADITVRYGVDGAIYGDSDFNVETQTSLWPWPNEARIKKEMCVDSGITRGFCSNSTQKDGASEVTLSSYIWEYLGNAVAAAQ
ncbi:hypothetical protein [Aliikangiella sp. G2MR2-5]|uniref:hypothetical protein n=1 Tax=Aliikangiella sp. G2MR2-5 TaxID=2788943 RepID=UPI0018A8C771|nr:hypothetical protein [Aliikangiella sp. G2MR2-5]